MVYVNRAVVDVSRNQKEPPVNQCPVSPLQKPSRDGAAVQDLVSMLGRQSTDDGQHVTEVVGDIQTSPGGGNTAVSDAENVANASVADQSQTMPSDSGKYN